MAQRKQGCRSMNSENREQTRWSASEETILLLAREMEWAEAYLQDYPECRMGQIYFDFLRWEMITTQADL